MSAHGPSASSHFGHDKSLEIKPYAALPDGERPILLYAGDGVSDLSAAAETNLLFAKEGKGNNRTTGLFNWRPETDYFPRSGYFLPAPRHALHHLPGLVHHPIHLPRHSRWQEVAERGRRPGEEHLDRINI